MDLPQRELRWCLAPAATLSPRRAWHHEHRSLGELTALDVRVEYSALPMTIQRAIAKANVAGDTNYCVRLINPDIMNRFELEGSR